MVRITLANGMFGVIRIVKSLSQRVQLLRSLAVEWLKPLAPSQVLRVLVVAALESPHLAFRLRRLVAFRLQELASSLARLTSPLQALSARALSGLQTAFYRLLQQDHLRPAATESQPEAPQSPQMPQWQRAVYALRRALQRLRDRLVSQSRPVASYLDHLRYLLVAHSARVRFALAKAKHKLRALLRSLRRLIRLSQQFAQYLRKAPSHLSAVRLTLPPLRSVLLRPFQLMVERNGSPTAPQVRPIQNNLARRLASRLNPLRLLLGKRLHKDG